MEQARLFGASGEGWRLFRVYVAEDRERIGFRSEPGQIGMNCGPAAPDMGFENGMAAET